jgi:predicted metal-binding membrane protein
MPDTGRGADRPPTFVELVLRADRAPLLLLLVLLPLVCWAWIAVMARDMYGTMRGASAWMMTPVWDAPHVLLLWAMWAVMMAGMMLPSATPALLLFGAAARRRHGGRGASRHIYALTFGYLGAWALFSLAATAGQRLLAVAWLVSPMMTVTSGVAGGALLALAGLYQLTPFKRACLQACQSPLGFMMRHWRQGTGGAFRMGFAHGASCVGCCWALMLLLFVGGVMNLAVIAALTALVAFEKLGPFGVPGARVSGVVLIVAGAWMALR